MSLTSTAMMSDYGAYGGSINNQTTDLPDTVPTLVNFLIFGALVGSLSSLLCAMALFGVQILFMLITLPLHSGLVSLNRQLKSLFQNSAGSYDKSFFTRLSDLSTQHLELTVRISELDNVFGPMLLWLFVSDLYVIVTGLGIIKGSVVDSGGLFSQEYTPDKFVGSICLGLILLVLRIFCAVRVEEQSGAFSTTFAILMERHRIADRCGGNYAGYVQTVNTRLERVTGTFTLYELCHLDKSFVATVIGVMLTYITLLWEMDKK
ncbi:uncharacterized protein LOC129595343 [Paramacrobiotus metropolitanus]|uniref:uncharacterized protein LOC129595343 n=1 Tax=Paramacrobiotus metropolitanus TaxID=2943436 RepID=UPI0024462F63|nr:uncharacterized protein LOC129595343 [Paramacrobiotus metropolitanus]